ncbi:hypothetical protein ACFPES_03200 [Paenibacillus sp. GCM10023248]|uniref:hypothetical protein n=1 Tax=unclassified Paenibacillus TaxID=185978 RepID=UPI002378D249|nr:hypothetical protein [Paenibacillus sp. MAHUQ-63]MDD9266032.1 hypothetical protein [Paenibacillus sp. MAHUQ-63]
MSFTTKEEQDDISTYVILPLLLDLIDKYMWFPEVTPLKHLHPDQFQELLDMVTVDHVECKQRLKAANVKVVKNWKVGETLDYKIYVRRYEENFSLWKGLAKAELQIRLGKYVARLDKSKFKKIAAAPVEKKEQNIDGKLFVNFE